MSKRFGTVVHIGQFETRAKGRMTATDIDTVIDMLAADPLCGDLIQGTGGVRKVRIAVRGNSPLKKASLTGFHATAKHIAAKAVSPSSETMRTI